MTIKKIGTLWLVLSALLIGCSQGADQPPASATPVSVDEARPTPTAAETEVAPSPTATTPPLPTVTPEPTPITPAVTVGDQTLTEAGSIAIDSVISAEPGWLALFTDDEGLPGALLGHEAVPAAEEVALTVQIDPYAATTTLHARLHLDGGISGEFEYPGTDMPATGGAGEVAETFAVELDLPLPSITISDQTIAQDGLIRVDEVFTLSPNWLVIHTLDNETLGPPIGQTPLDKGRTVDLAFPINWQEATAELAAILYEDNERPGGFSPATDLPVLKTGEPVRALFTVELPPDIFLYDQPIIDGKLVFEHVISEQPGWVVIFNVNEEGQSDRIIGSKRVSKGINPLLEADLSGSAITPLISLALHEETNNPAEFNFPLADPAATYNGEPIPPTIVNTNPGNYLITRDQALGEKNQVTIPLVVTDLDTWLVVYKEAENGQPGEIIGQTWLPAGVNRDSRVTIPSGMAGENLLAVLHQDADNEREFEYPDGDDVPLQRNRQIIFSPFSISAYTETASFTP